MMGMPRNLKRIVRRSLCLGGCTFILSACLVFAALAWAGATFEPLVRITILAGEAAGDNFGKSVAGIGDFSGDGFEDLAVGAPYADVAADAGGAVYLFFGGGEILDSTPDLVLSGATADDHFGISVDGGQDLDGDQCPDLAIGARLDDAGATDGGAVYVYPGCESPMPSPLLLAAEASDDWFGQSLALAGDVNGDGHGDLIVGAPYNDQNGNAAGKAHIFFGGPALDDVADVELFGDAQANTHFGWSVAGVGDVNSDGFDDVMVGARLHTSDGKTARGRAYLFLGGEAMNAVPDQVFEGEEAHDWFGEAVGKAGDVNDDGYADIVVGAIYNDLGGDAAGKAYIFLGGDSVDATPDYFIAGPEPHAQLGNALDGGRDFDNDGISDVLVGAHFADASDAMNSGRTSLFFGSGTVPGERVLHVYGRAADDQMGESVAAVGHIMSTAATSSFLSGAHFADTAGNGSGEALFGFLENSVIFTDGFESIGVK